jgi:hypothetical protein
MFTKMQFNDLYRYTSSKNIDSENDGGVPQLHLVSSSDWKDRKGFRRCLEMGVTVAKASTMEEEKTGKALPGEFTRGLQYLKALSLGGADRELLPLVGGAKKEKVRIFFQSECLWCNRFLPPHTCIFRHVPSFDICEQSLVDEVKQGKSGSQEYPKAEGI